MFVLLQVLTFVGFTPWSTIVVGALTGVFMIPTTSLYMAYSS
jgi:hypothetical protein